LDPPLCPRGLAVSLFRSPPELTELTSNDRCELLQVAPEPLFAVVLFDVDFRDHLTQLTDFLCHFSHLRRYPGAFNLQIIHLEFRVGCEFLQSLGEEGDLIEPVGVADM